jgi:hypothetical protein
VLVGVAAHLLCGLPGLALGVLCSRPSAPRQAYAWLWLLVFLVLTVPRRWPGVLAGDGPALAGRRGAARPAGHPHADGHRRRAGRAAPAPPRGRLGGVLGRGGRPPAQAGADAGLTDRR